MMIKDSPKTRKQLTFVENFRTCSLAYFEACTGFGKTIVALMILERMTKYNPKLTTLVIVPYLPLKTQWEEKLLEWGLSADVYVVNTAVKTYFEHYDFIIIDEAHRMTTYTAEVFNQALSIKSRFKLCLSATFSKTQIEFMESFGLRSIGKVSLEEAIANNWVENFIQYKINIPLKPYNLETYKKVNQEYNKLLGWFNNDFTLAVQCSNKDFRENYAKEKELDPAKVGYYSIATIRAYGKIQNIINKSVEKVDAIAEIVNKLKNKKIIVFSESTDFADMIKERLPDKCLSYHSKLESMEIVKEYQKEFKRKKSAELFSIDNNASSLKEENDKYIVTYYKKLKLGKQKSLEYTLELFKNNPSIRVLATAKALDEGIDLPDLEVAIIASGTRNVRQQIQRIGRVIRLGSGKEVKVINLVLNETIEDTSFRARNRLIYKNQTLNQFLNDI